VVKRSQFLLDPRAPVGEDGLDRLDDAEGEIDVRPAVLGARDGRADDRGGADPRIRAGLLEDAAANLLALLRREQR
jgi:hypothetical protein